MIRVKGVLRRLLPEQHGQIFALFAVSAVGLLGMVGFVVDAGRVYVAHRQLQAAADAAATAGADALPDVNAATAAANSYSAAAGDKNASSNLSGVTTTVTTKCITGLACNPANTIVVTQQAVVSTVFAKIFGINSFTISAKSTASMGGGKPKPAHVMIVLDRTGSMNSSCSAGGTKLTCAKNGIDAFLNGMDPAYDKVGLVIFSPALDASKICSTPPNNNSWFDNSSSLWVVAPLATDYKTSATSPLNQSSFLVSTVNCIKGGGSTAYAYALDQAQSVLTANHDPKAQDAIIFFTDGEANYGSWWQGTGSNYLRKPCQQAVSSAASAKATGTWIYSIDYDTPANITCNGWKSSGSQGGSACNTTQGKQFPCDEVTAPIYAYNTLQAIASDSTKFFYEPNPGDLTTIFQNVAEDLQSARIIDDNYAGS